jgi:hypothetical protein
MKPDNKRTAISMNDSRDETMNIDHSFHQIVIANEHEDKDSNVKMTKKEVKTCKQLLKESINLPFITGIIAITIASIPYVNEFMANPDYAPFNLIISKLYILTPFRTTRGYRQLLLCVCNHFTRT